MVTLKKDVLNYYSKGDRFLVTAGADEVCQHGGELHPLERREFDKPCSVGNGSEMPAAKQIYAYNFHQLLATQCGGLLHPVLPMNAPYNMIGTVRPCSEISRSELV